MAGLDFIIELLENPIIATLFRIIVVLILLKIALKFNTKLFNNAQNKLKNTGHTKNITYLSFLKHMSVAVIYFIAVISIGDTIPGFDNTVSALLASTGILTVVIGFASQEAMSSLVSGVMILTFKPFIIGDVITFNGNTGIVEEITLRHTVIKTFENKRLIVPNSSINNDIIENANYLEDKVCTFLEIGIGYNSSIDKAREIILTNATSHKDYLDNRTEQDLENGVPAVIIRVSELGDSSITMRASIWAENNATAFAMKCDLLESIKKDFDKNAIEIPFPQVTISYTKD
ncbi:MAG: mechanosensitive ion channel family protein [Clostridia bacterium]